MLFYAAHWYLSPYTSDLNKDNQCHSHPHSSPPSSHRASQEVSRRATSYNELLSPPSFCNFKDISTLASTHILCPGPSGTPHLTYPCRELVK